MSERAWGFIWWFGGWVGLGFFLPELLGFYKIAPWPTLSQTVWNSEAVNPWVAVLIFATLVFLGAHFLYHRPLWASILFGLAVAVSAHLLDRSWP